MTSPGTIPPDLSPAYNNSQLSPPLTPILPIHLLVSTYELVCDRQRLLYSSGAERWYAGLLHGSVRVAIKIPGGRARERAGQEAEIWAGLGHRNGLFGVERWLEEVGAHVAFVAVLSMLAYSTSPPAIATDLFPGGCLLEFLARQGRRRDGDELRWMLSCLHDVASGMGYLHSLDIIHGDLRASNVVVDGGVAKILGTHLARRWGRLDPMEAAAGMPGYMSPELIAGVRCKQADVFAYAMLCFEVFSQQPPFHGADPLVSLTDSRLDDSIQKTHLILACRLKCTWLLMIRDHCGPTGCRLHCGSWFRAAGLRRPWRDLGLPQSRPKLA